MTGSSGAPTGNGLTGKAEISDPAKFLSDGISQLTMGSFQSVHSNAVEKNRILSTLLLHGVETTVDRLVVFCPEARLKGSFTQAVSIETTRLSNVV